MSSLGSFTGLTEGTLGLGVADRNGQNYALTCSHVASPWFRDPLGDSMESPPDQDGEAGPNTIGTVFSWTSLVPDTSHECDAALVLPAAGVQPNDALRLHPTIPSAASRWPISPLDPRRRVQAFTRRKVISGVVQAC
jgi:hypothetical protein